MSADDVRRDDDVIRDDESPSMVFGRPPTRPKPRGDDAPEPDPAEADPVEPIEVAEPAGEAGEPIEMGPVEADETSEPVEASETDETDEPVAPDEVDLRVNEPTGVGGDGAAATATDTGAELAATGTSVVTLLGEATGLRQRWETVQAGFVDDPRGAVQAADDMVTTAVAEMEAVIDGLRAELAGRWRDDPTASTDALLRAFQGYRAVFERVLSA